MTTTVLVLVETINEYLPIIESNDFHVILAPTPAERAQAIKAHGGQIKAVLTRGPLGLYAEEIAALPLLEIICVIGAGYEHVDLQAASNRGIVVTNGAGVNAPSVADHAMALLLSLVRGIPQTDAAVRHGEWPKVMRPSLGGKQLGILGLGAVGLEIAKRAALGFGMQVSYHNRQPRDDVDYIYCSTAVELAHSSDFLILATPGGCIGAERLPGEYRPWQRGGDRRPGRRPGTTAYRRRGTGCVRRRAQGARCPQAPEQYRADLPCGRAVAGSRARYGAAGGRQPAGVLRRPAGADAGRLAPARKMTDQAR
jgi:hypothetical protein